MKNNDAQAYASTPTSQLLAAGDCCKSDQCGRCFLCEEKRCTDILIALLTDRLAMYANTERKERQREKAEAKAKAQRYPNAAGRCGD